MTELDALTAQRDALRAARYSGALSVRAGEQQVTYRSDAELRAALAELEARIEALQGRRPLRRVRAWCAKGL